MLADEHRIAGQVTVVPVATFPGVGLGAGVDGAPGQTGDGEESDNCGQMDKTQVTEVEPSVHEDAPDGWQRVQSCPSCHNPARHSALTIHDIMIMAAKCYVK